LSVDPRGWSSWENPIGHREGPNPPGKEGRFFSLKKQLSQPLDYGPGAMISEGLSYLQMRAIFPSLISFTSTT
jgi:hypothetical protein